MAEASPDNLSECLSNPACHLSHSISAGLETVCGVSSFGENYPYNSSIAICETPFESSDPIMEIFTFLSSHPSMCTWENVFRCTAVLFEPVPSMIPWSFHVKVR